ncbi:hypothetical protein O181_109589 [Austropuccinia psidii MF-1]|uniref:Integrase catalytic domain-containing protein n=1 Tax=Austropuccinia psidii MF-1 TaxID=1389203 RepID=A0A9Q3JYD5_9BASI|nr:hypothetical protein [Austropuccinia psidii MF-1]
MDWVTGLPPGGDRSYNAFLVIVDRFSKTTMFLPCHKDDTAMDTALLIQNRVVLWTGIFTNIISDRDPEFTSALWTNLHQLFGTNLSLSTAYHPQTYGLAESMIQTLEDLVTYFVHMALSQGLLWKQEWPSTQESRTHLEGSKKDKEIRRNKFI